MAFVQKSNFFSFAFCGIINSEKLFFLYILDRNEWFLDQKGNVVRSAKKSTFFQKFSPWFLTRKLKF